MKIIQNSAKPVSERRRIFPKGDEHPVGQGVPTLGKGRTKKSDIEKRRRWRSARSLEGQLPQAERFFRREIRRVQETSKALGLGQEGLERLLALGVLADGLSESAVTNTMSCEH